MENDRPVSERLGRTRGAGVALLVILSALLCLPWAGGLLAAEGEEPPKKEEGAEDPKGGAGEGEKKEEALDEETRKVLDLMDKTHGKIRALEAPFAQLKKVSLSRKPRKSKGVLYIRKEPGKGGMKVLFVVKTEPFRSKVLFTDKEVVFHDMESGEITRRDPRQGGVKPSEIWVLGRPVSEIVKHYTPRLVPLEEKEGEGKEEGKILAKLELVPKSKKVRKWVKRVLVWLRKGDGLGTRVRIVDRSGDYQEFSFDEKKLEINPELDDGLFEID